MKLEKPRYPIVLIAYEATNNGEMIIERRVINDEDEEKDFRGKYKGKSNLIKKEEPKGEDYKGLKNWNIIAKNIPNWVYFIAGILITILAGVLSNTLFQCR